MSTDSTTTTTTNLSNSHYFNLEPNLATEAQSIASDVISLLNNLKRHNLKVAIELGSKLSRAKSIFINTRSLEYWQNWIEQELNNELSHDTVTNLINLYNLSEEYGEEYFKGISNLNLGALYILARSSIEPELKEKILQKAEEVLEDTGKPLNKQEVSSLLTTYRKLKLAQASVNPKAIPLLSQSPLAEDPKQLEALSKLSQKKQLQIAELIDSTPDNLSVKQALKELKETRSEPLLTEEFILSPIESSSFKSPGVHGLKKLKSESVQIVFVEAPMNSDFVCNPDNDFKKLCIELHRILTPGGFALSVIGHKASTFTGPIVSECGLSCAHVLVLRRQPGRSHQIVGINIIAASILILFIYKPPFSHPHNMIADLYTFDESDSSSPEILSGIENGLSRIITPLINPGDTIAHCTFSDQNFSVRPFLKELANNNGCSSFIEVGP